MNTKEECLAFLDKSEEEINNYKWEAQAEEFSDLIPHKDMLGYLKDFNLPEPAHVDDKGASLPKDWLANHDPNSSEDYKEVAERYFEVYSNLREEASKELEAFNLEAERDERDMHQEFYSLVGWRK